jgi:hypothetical protein
MRRPLCLAALLLAVAAPAADATPKYAWGKDPGPIVGKWKASCAASSGLVIEIVADGDKKALGKIVTLGAAKKYGHKEGEEFFKLEADDFGDWVGRVHYRAIDGTDRWDPIRIVATPDGLNATITIDDCWKRMTHG